MKNEIIVEHKYVIKTDKPLDQKVVEQYFNMIDQTLKQAMQQQQSTLKTEFFRGKIVLPDFYFGTEEHVTQDVDKAV